MPIYGSPHAAGMDLFANTDDIIPPSEHRLISSGICLAIPSTHYGRIAPRSGIALRDGIHVGAGVVDSDFRNVIKILIFIFGERDFHVHVGDRIAQIVFERYNQANLILVDELPETARDKAGFGSTGD